MELNVALKKQAALIQEIGFLERVTDGKFGAHDRAPESLYSDLYHILLEKRAEQKRLDTALSSIVIEL